MGRHDDWFWLLNQPLPERHQAYFYQLEMLAAKRYTYNSEIQQYTEEYMCDGGAQSTAQQPYDVEYHRKTARIPATAFHMCAEWR